MPDRKFYLYDTFNGFDERDIDIYEECSKNFRETFIFNDTNFEVVLKNIAYRGNAIIRKGYFPETIGETEKDEKFAFVSLDMDLYKPTMAGLNFFWPRLSPGGVIFVHDFVNPGFMRVNECVMTFCKKYSIGYVKVQEKCGISTAVITKPYKV